MAPGTQFVSTIELCAQLGVSRDTVARWVREGCPTLRTSARGSFRFDPNEVVAWARIRDEQRADAVSYVERFA